MDQVNVTANHGVGILLRIIGCQLKHLDNGLAFVLYRASNSQVVTTIGELYSEGTLAASVKLPDPLIGQYRVQVKELVPLRQLVSHFYVKTRDRFWVYFRKPSFTHFNFPWCPCVMISKLLFQAALDKSQLYLQEGGVFLVALPIIIQKYLRCAMVKWPLLLDCFIKSELRIVKLKSAARHMDMSFAKGSQICPSNGIHVVCP